MYYSRIITPCVTEFFYINSLIVLFNISAELFFANAAVFGTSNLCLNPYRAVLYQRAKDKRVRKSEN